MPRARNPRLWATLPLIMVLVLLASLIIVPIVIQRRVGQLRFVITDIAEPSRNLVYDLQISIGREIVGARGYLLTRDPDLRRIHEQAQARRDSTYALLLPLAEQLGPNVYEAVLRLGVLLEAPDRVIDSLYAGQISRDRYDREIPVQQARYEAITIAGAVIDERIGKIVVANSEQASATERTGAIIIVILAMLSAIAALLVARLGRGYQRLADNLQRRAQWRQAMSDAARDLGAATTLSQVTQVAVDHARATTQSLGSYIELIDESDPTGDVEILAVSGSGSPPPNLRVPYPGSLSEKIVSTREPEVLTDLDAIGEHVAPYLRTSCAECTGLVVPLAAENRFVGAMVHLRSAGEKPFSQDEIAFARAFGDLVTAAIRRVRLLEAVTEAELRFRQIANHLKEVIWLGAPDLSTRYYVNPAYETVFGRSIDSFYQDPDSLVEPVHSADRERVERELESLRYGDFESRYRIARPGGEVRWIWSRGYPIYDEQGNVFRIAGIMEDITEQKLAENERERLLADIRDTRDQLTDLLETMNEGFYALDVDGRVLYVNREAERILDTPRDRLLGRVIWDVFPDLVSTPAYAEHRRALEQRETVHFEHNFDQSGIWADVRIAPSHDGVSVLFQDITERRRSEQLLRESERNFRGLGNSIPQLVWMAEPDGRIFWYNQRWYEYTGTTPGEMEMREPGDFVPPEDRDRVVNGFRQAIATGTPWEDTFEMRNRPGTYRWFLTRAVPVRDEHGDIVRWFGTNTDVTDRIKATEEREHLLERERHARQEAERRGEELRRVSESRSTLMRGFSHDVKNPLGAADGYLQLLEDGIFEQLTRKQLQSVANVRRSIRSALDLIEDLLGLARAEVGQVDITTEPTDVRHVARDAAEEYRAQAESEGLHLDVDCPREFPIIESDPHRIRQVIGNLLSNAVKYTKHGGVHVDVTVREDGAAPRPGRWIAVDVHDTGPGISEEQQKTVFEEFRRGPAPPAEPGSGIGLAISQRIAHALDGEITLTSYPGEGSTFTLWLPAKRIPPA